MFNIRISILSLLLSTQLYVNAINKETAIEILPRTLTSAHTAVFSKENLFSEPLENVQRWADVLKEIENYIKKSTKDENILKALNNTLKLNTELIDNIKLAYTTSFAKKDNVPNVQTQSEFTNKFKDIAQRAKNNNNDLDINRWNKFKPIANLDRKALADSNKVKALFKSYTPILDITDLLYRLLLTLETTALKAQKDYSKEVAKRTKK